MTTDPYPSSADPVRLSFTLRVGGPDPERLIFFLSGELLGPSCTPFERFTSSCIDGGTRRLRLDLAELHSLDFDGVNSLLAVHHRLSAEGGRLIITNANPEVMSVLRLFGRPLLATETSAIFAPASAPASRASGRQPAEARGQADPERAARR